MKQEIERYVTYAKQAHTVGLRSYYLGIIESITGEACPFTGYAFMIGHKPAMDWLA